jgi:Asp-tRNA(Asn)/Glu-tRNA(Gln) amidotransferase C subunit
VTEQPVDPATFVDQMAAIVGLPLQPEHRQGVIDNFERIMAVAQMVNEFPVSEEIEIASIFEP